MKLTNIILNIFNLKYNNDINILKEFFNNIEILNKLNNYIEKNYKSEKYYINNERFYVIIDEYINE